MNVLSEVDTQHGDVNNALAELHIIALLSDLVRSAIAQQMLSTGGSIACQFMMGSHTCGVSVRVRAFSVCNYDAGSICKRSKRNTFTLRREETERVLNDENNVGAETIDPHCSVVVMLRLSNREVLSSILDCVHLDKRKRDLSVLRDERIIRAQAIKGLRLLKYYMDTAHAAASPTALSVNLHKHKSLVQTERIALPVHGIWQLMSNYRGRRRAVPYAQYDIKAESSTCSGRRDYR
ncbi:hypothetical protein J6590_057267 [Homalodisca vitripennis]|nr:hypothetical protein J6590_057267 [Homalodisca vitripennis]